MTIHLYVVLMIHRFSSSKVLREVGQRLPGARRGGCGPQHSPRPAELQPAGNWPVPWKHAWHRHRAHNRDALSCFPAGARPQRRHHQLHGRQGRTAQHCAVGCVRHTPGSAIMMDDRSSPPARSCSSMRCRVAPQRPWWRDTGCAPVRIHSCNPLAGSSAPTTPQPPQPTAPTAPTAAGTDVSLDKGMHKSLYGKGYPLADVLSGKHHTFEVGRSRLTCAYYDVCLG
jgi:hypothetical protein